jgi:hypothetical protein
MMNQSRTNDDLEKRLGTSASPIDPNQLRLEYLRELKAVNCPLDELGTIVHLSTFHDRVKYGVPLEDITVTLALLRAAGYTKEQAMIVTKYGAIKTPYPNYRVPLVDARAAFRKAGYVVRSTSSAEQSEE